MILGAPTGEVPAADDLISTLKLLCGGLGAKESKARTTYKEKAGKHRRSRPSLTPGDLVMVETENFRLHLKSRKLGPRQIGPFKISKQFNEVAYQVDLLKSSKVYPVFQSVPAPKI